jgi:hypothetical protein
MTLYLANGSEIDLRARYNGGRRGPNYSYAIFDEAAKEFNLLDTIDTINTVRQRECKVVLCVTTPRMDTDYASFAHQPDHSIITATSYDNPYRDHESIRSAEAQMPDLYRRQEIMGEFISQSSGLYFPSFSTQMWPAGNILRGASFTPGQPYYLGCDIGRIGAYQIYQQVREYEGVALEFPLMCLVAEMTPNDKNVNEVVNDINRLYGRPRQIYVGVDADNNPNFINGISASYVFGQKWHQVPITWPISPLTRKNLQHFAALGAIHNVSGKRRFVIAENLTVHNPDTKRGLLDTLTKMSFPENPSGDNKLFETNKHKNRYIDSCDAFLYTMVCHYPPQANRYTFAA